MNTETTTAPAAEAPAFVPDCYVVSHGGRRTGYTPARIERRTKTTITAVTVNGTRYTFNIPKYGDTLHERGESRHSLYSKVLSLDVEGCAARRAAQDEEIAMTRRYEELRDALVAAVDGRKNGMGRFCGTYADLDRMAQALRILKGEA